MSSENGGHFVSTSMCYYLFLHPHGYRIIPIRISPPSTLPMRTLSAPNPYLNFINKIYEFQNVDIKVYIKRTYQSIIEL